MREGNAYMVRFGNGFDTVIRVISFEQGDDAVTCHSSKADNVIPLFEGDNPNDGIKAISESNHVGITFSHRCTSSTTSPGT